MTTTTSAPALASFAQRVVRGAVTFMAVTTIAATVVGFWLSYAGLHAFAHRSGLHGAEAWAWPASVDLFILAGELGITISAIRRKRDPLSWVFLLAGFGPSVAFNVLHVTAIAPHWWRYAVAAVPPVAAMLALAALMRQVYRLAVEAHLATGQPEIGSSAAGLVAVPPDAVGAAEVSLRATHAAGNPLSANQLQERFSLTRAQATKLRTAVLAEQRPCPGYGNRGRR
jgi:Protein of unknown function (DUF2637)